MQRLDRNCASLRRHAALSLFTDLTPKQEIAEGTSSELLGRLVFALGMQGWLFQLMQQPDQGKACAMFSPKLPDSPCFRSLDPAQSAPLGAAVTKMRPPKNKKPGS